MGKNKQRREKLRELYMKRKSECLKDDVEELIKTNKNFTYYKKIMTHMGSCNNIFNFFDLFLYKIKYESFLKSHVFETIIAKSDGKKEVMCEVLNKLIAEILDNSFIENKNNENN